MFKGTIEKRIMSQVKTFIKNAEQEFKDFCTAAEDQHKKDTEALNAKLEADKTAKENEVVSKIVGKFM